MKRSSYSPPYSVSTKAIRLISEISEAIGHLAVDNPARLVPQLRRSNRLRTIHASLAIENNSLSLEQVTAIVNGKRVLGPPREIKEVENAYSIYEKLEKLDPYRQEDLLLAHKALMQNLTGPSGAYRREGVGIHDGTDVIHVAPPAKRVPMLMGDLFAWLKKTDEHPLVTSSVFHYELEFIHPFADGNGRMGRLWQTLILSRWKPLFAYLPVETVIHRKQAKYYAALAKADKLANSTPFIEFILQSTKESLSEFTHTDQVSDQVSDQVKKLAPLLKKTPLSAMELMRRLKLSHRASFRKYYLHPALTGGIIEMTVPDKPNSRMQKYRITPQGRRLLKEMKP